MSWGTPEHWKRERDAQPWGTPEYWDAERRARLATEDEERRKQTYSAGMGMGKKPCRTVFISCLIMFAVFALISIFVLVVLSWH